MAIRDLLPEIWRGEASAWNPVREMNRLQRRMDRVFDEFFREYPAASEEAEFSPACDVAETSTHYLMSFDLPGVKKNEVKVQLEDNTLTVSGERQNEHEAEAEGRISRERYYGSFCRSFTLPANALADKIEANYENGVLQVAIPKTKATPGKDIPIKEGKLIAAKPGKAA